MAGVEVGSAYVSILPSARGFGSSLQSQLGSSSAKAGKDAGDKAGKSFGASLKGHILAAGGLMAGAFAVDKVVGFFKDANAEARESQKVGALTANVIKSTGGAAQVTAKQVGDLAAAISNKTGIDDETIQSGANMLLTFKNIRNEAGKGNDIFNQSTSILTDMSAAMGTEPKQAAIQLGKALNDPVKGVSALSRVGVTFTDQQKKTIKSLVDGGNTAKAQKVILAELSSEFGGAATAQATMGDKVKTGFANLKEAIGTAFLPVIDQLLGKLNAILPKVIAFTSEAGPKLSAGIKQAMPTLKAVGSAVGQAFGFIVSHGKTVAVVVTGIAGAFLIWKTATTAITVATKAMMVAQGIAKVATVGWSVATKAAAAAQWLMNAAMTANPIGIVVAAIAAVVGGLVLFFTKTETGRKIWSKFSGAIVAGAKAIGAFFTEKLIPFFTKTIPGAVGKLIGWVRKNWPLILAILTGPIGLAVLAITKNWDKITGAFSAAKKWVSGTWKKGWSGAKAWIGGAVEGGRDKARDALQAAQDRFSELKTWTSSTWKKGWSAAKGWISDPVGSAKTLIGEHQDKIRGALNGLDSWGRKTFGPNWDKMKGKLSKPIADAKAYFSKIFAKGAKGGILTLFSDMVDNAGRIFGRIKGALVAPIKAAINAINTGLIKGGINWILGKLGVDKKNQVPWIPVPKFAAGDRVRGANAWQRGGTDRIPALLDHDEFVFKRSAARAIGYDKLSYMNDYGRLPAFAAGGRVWPTNTRRMSGNYAGHSGVDIAAGMGAPIYAPEDGRIAYTGWGRGYGQAIFQQFASGLQAVFGHTSRVLVSAGQIVKAGQRIGLVGSTGNSTGPHLHFEVNSPSAFGSSGNRAKSLAYLNGANIEGSDGGGPLSGVFDFLKGLSPLQFLKNKAEAVAGKITGGGIFGQGLARIPAMIIDKAKDWIGSNLFGGDSGEPGGSGVQRWAAQVKQALAMNNLPTSSSYVNAWLRQIQSESGGNPKAVQNGYVDVNTLSGDLAKGLLQTISATFNAYKFPGYGDIFNGFHNMLAAMNYAKHRYPNMLSVIGHGHGYATGTNSAAPGWAWVGENGPELVNFRGGEQVKTNKESIASMQKPIEFNNCQFGANPREVAVEIRREQRRSMDAANLSGVG